VTALDRRKFFGVTAASAALPRSGAAATQLPARKGDVMSTGAFSEAPLRRIHEVLPGYFDSHGWGFGVSIVTKRVDM
jgi:hypothetical protein